MAESDSWKGVNVNLGVLAACILGVFTVLAAYTGVQQWVDTRVDDAVAPLEQKLETVVEDCRRSCYRRWNGVDQPSTVFRHAACEARNDELAAP